MQLSDFAYELPPELIAQSPPESRDGARMLVIDRAAGSWRDGQFRDLPEYIRSGDCVVLNNSRVIPSRLYGVSDSGARIQIFLVKPVEGLRWIALGRPGRRLLPGRRVHFGEGLSAEILETHAHGERLIEFHGPSNPDDLLASVERLGHVPLPPYIHRADTALDRERYQTVFAEQRGSVAAPTAGLHFTPDMLDQIRDRGAQIARVTLHVGLGTFQPIDREDFEHHQLHHEYFEIDPAAWHSIDVARRVLAVGTTSVRTIESAAQTGTLAGETNLFLHPGCAAFRKTGAMLTNFHLPESSLLLLVCAFAGTELTLEAYRHAVRERYRFFSYGDCMLIV